MEDIVIKQLIETMPVGALKKKSIFKIFILNLQFVKKCWLMVSNTADSYQRVEEASLTV